MKRCKSCRTRTESDDNICPVCGIEQDKLRKDLSAPERHVRRSARNIRILAMFHLILCGILIMQLPETEYRVGVGAIAIINLIIAVGLINYDFRAYRLAVICYFGYGMVNIISIQHGSVHLAGILLALTAIYLVGNKTAKAIFERRLPGQK